jgi:hypothetical protein
MVSRTLPPVSAARPVPRARLPGGAMAELKLGTGGVVGSCGTEDEQAGCGVLAGAGVAAIDTGKGSRLGVLAAAWRGLCADPALLPGPVHRGGWNVTGSTPHGVRGVPGGTGTGASCIPDLDGVGVRVADAGVWRSMPEDGGHLCIIATSSRVMLPTPESTLSSMLPPCALGNLGMLPLLWAWPAPAYLPWPPPESGGFAFISISASVAAAAELQDR